MRTNIVLDEALLSQAMKYTTARSKRAVVQEALATYVTVKAEEQKVLAYRDRLAAIRRRVVDAPVRTSARTLVRADRERAS